MHILLFIFYGLLLGYAITRIPFFKQSGIKPVFLIGYFALRVATGCLHNGIAYRYYHNHGDIWLFFNDSFITRHELFTDLKLFWADNSTLAWLPHNLIECLHLVLNFLSFDNLAINTLFFSFLTLSGAIALFRVFADRFPNDPLSAIGVLLLPSTLFWTSCILTEGILYIILGFFLFHLNKLLTSDTLAANPSIIEPNPSIIEPNLAIIEPNPAIIEPAVSSPSTIKSIPGDPSIPKFITGNPATSISGLSVPDPRPIRRALLCLFLLATAIFFRPAIAIGLLPATGCWILLAKGMPRRRLTIFLLAGVAAAIVLAVIIPQFYLPILSQLSTRQAAFQELSGNSRIYLPILEPTWNSVAKVLPTALFNGFFQPLPGSGGQAVYGAFSLELIGIWGIIITSLYHTFFRSRSLRNHPRNQFHNPSPLPESDLRHPGKYPPSPLSPFGLFCLLFSVLAMGLIGFIIPFVGSIIRYRSIYLPFLLAPFLHNLRYLRGPVTLNSWLKTKISNYK